MFSPGHGSTKHLHPRAVKGHSVHCTEKKGGRVASNASGELRAALLPNSPLSESWLAVGGQCVCVCTRGGTLVGGEGGERAGDPDAKINTETG